MESKIAVFCFGSNSAKQLRARVKNDTLISHASYLVGYKRIFAGKAKSWDGGGVASLIQTKNSHDKCVGTLVFLTEKELQLLDRFEGIDEGNDPFCSDCSINVYRREWLDAYLCDQVSSMTTDTTISICNQVKAIAYIKNDHEWKEYPSEKYLEACYNNISPFWPELDGNSTLIVSSCTELQGMYSGPSKVIVSTNRDTSHIAPSFASTLITSERDDLC